MDLTLINFESEADLKIVARGRGYWEDGHVDTPEEIVARVEEAMRYVAPERLSLNPDCGFAPGVASEIPLDEAYLKLKSEAEAARRLRDAYG